MTYALVDLVDDQAPESPRLLTYHLQREHAPTETFREPSPAHAAVSVAAASKGGTPTAVCLAHGSPNGLGSTGDDIWANAEQLGDMFHNGRLYAYACDTTGDGESLGARAVDAGVAVFVGHDRVVGAPLPDHERRMVAAVAGAAILAFIAGEDDENALIRAIYAVGDELLDDDIDLSFADDANWTRWALFDQLAFSLRVHRRTRSDRSIELNPDVGA